MTRNFTVEEMMFKLQIQGHTCGEQQNRIQMLEIWLQNPHSQPRHSQLLKSVSCQEERKQLIAICFSKLKSD